MKFAKKRFYFLALLFTIILSLTLYKSSLGYFFFQDDFFNFNITQINNVWDFLSFFKFRSDIIAYRPISLQTYYYLSHLAFNFNSLPFRVVGMGLFFLCFLLIFKVTSIIIKNKKAAIVAASLWVLSSIHFMSLTQINYNIIGTFFYLLTTLAFLNFLKVKNFPLYVLTILSFFVTLVSFEFSVTWPAITGFYYLVVLKHSVGKTFKVFFPFIIIDILYLFLRNFYVKPPPVIEYQIAVNFDSAKALFWYVLWSVNVPEEFKKQAVKNLIILNNDFLWQFWPLISVSFIAFIWEIILGVLLPAYYIIKDKLAINLRLASFFIFWFALSISPVLLLPNHNFPMYLTLSSIGIYCTVSYLVIVSKKLFLFVPILLIWIISSKINIDFYKINSYAASSNKIALEFYQNMKANFPTLPKNSVVYYPLGAKSERQALMDQEAIKAIYRDQSLSIYYNKEELLKDLGKMNQKPVYIYLP